MSFKCILREMTGLRTCVISCFLYSFSLLVCKLYSAIVQARFKCILREITWLMTCGISCFIYSFSFLVCNTLCVEINILEFIFEQTQEQVSNALLYDVIIIVQDRSSYQVRNNETFESLVICRGRAILRVINWSLWSLGTSLYYLLEDVDAAMLQNWVS